MACCPVDGSLPVRTELQRPYFGLHRLDWADAADDPGGVEFNLPRRASGSRCSRRTGFEIVEYLELRNPDPDRPDSHGVGARWAHDFPAEQVWKLRKRAERSRVTWT